MPFLHFYLFYYQKKYTNIDSLLYYYGSLRVILNCPVTSNKPKEERLRKLFTIGSPLLKNEHSLN